jgi:hypothetical protein
MFCVKLDLYADARGIVSGIPASIDVHAGRLWAFGFTSGGANFAGHVKNSGRHLAVKFDKESYVR